MFEKKTALDDILNEIRDSRNQELVSKKDNRVFFTTVMKLEEGETKQQIYRIMEEYSVGENESLVRELFYIYKEKPELIAIIDPEIFEDDQIHQPRGVEAETNEEKEKWNLLVKDINEGRTRAKEKIKETALELGIDKKEIEGLSEIDIDKKVFLKIDEINKQNNRKTENKEEDKEGNKEDEALFNISSQDAKRIGIIGMNTMPLNQKVGIYDTLKQELGLDKQEQYADVDSIEIIPAYKLKELGCKVPDTPFVVAARHRDGSLEAFPESICKIYKGENDKITNIDGQKDQAKTEKANTIIKFEGKEDVSIAINQKSQYGIVEASLAYNTRDNDGRVALSLQDKYDGTDQNDYAARSIIDQRNGTEHKREVVKEGKKHAEGEVTSREDADGDINSADHLHENSVVYYDGREFNFNTLAITYGGCKTKEEVNKLLNKTNAELKADKTLNVENAIRKAIEEKNNEIIEQKAKEPEKVIKLMDDARIFDPLIAIRILETNNWNLQEAKDQCVEDYRNKKEEE